MGMIQPRKIIMSAALLIVGLIAGVFASDRGWDAWREAFGKEQPAVIEVPIAPRPVESVSLPPEPALPIVRRAPEPVPAALVTAPKKIDGLCDVSVAYPPGRSVVLNEIAWAEGSGAQWMELKNVTKNTIDISGWKILDRDGNPFALIEERELMSPNQILVLPELLGDLGNRGQWLKLFDSKCRLVDELRAADDWPGGEIFSKRTLERKLDISGWQTSFAAGGSRGEESSDGLPPPLPTLDRSGDVSAHSASPVPAQLPVIKSVRITGGPGQSDHDAVRIFNPGFESLSLGGWQLKKKSRAGTESSLKIFSPAAMISAEGYYLWANSKFVDAGADEVSSQTLAADNSVALYDPEGRNISEVSWGRDSVYPNPGAGEWLDFPVGLTPD